MCCTFHRFCFFVQHQMLHSKGLGWLSGGVATVRDQVPPPPSRHPFPGGGVIIGTLRGFSKPNGMYSSIIFKKKKKKKNSPHDGQSVNTSALFRKTRSSHPHAAQFWDTLSLQNAIDRRPQACTAPPDFAPSAPDVGQHAHEQAFHPQLRQVARHRPLDRRQVRENQTVPLHETVTGVHQTCRKKDRQDPAAENGTERRAPHLPRNPAMCFNC